MMTEKNSDNVDEKWYKRIKAARQRRDKYVDAWTCYARLHTNCYQAVKAKNDDMNVYLPDGDQIKAGAVHRNIEQTVSIIDVPEIGVRATALDYTHELGREDSHREAVVETAVFSSMSISGVVTEDETLEGVKRDGIIVGHGINYSAWRNVDREVEGDAVPVFEEDEIGNLVPVLNARGEQVFEREKTKERIFSSVQDKHISPLNFLFSASAKTMHASHWHGYEEVVRLETLQADSRYKIPAWIEGSSFKLKDLYGIEDEDEFIESDSVKLIVVWDKEGYELVHFIEVTPPEGSYKEKSFWSKSKKETKQAEKRQLIKIYSKKWPVMFSHPDHSPFTFFIPIPASDNPFGISQIEHIRNPALEKDKLRTRQANITREIKHLRWFNKNRIRQQDLEDALQAPDQKAVGIDIQDGEKAGELFGTLPGAKIDTELYRQGTLADDDVNRTSGIPEVPFSGADTATESENQMMVGGARPKRKKTRLLRFLSDVASRHCDLLREFAPSGQSMAITDASGASFTLEYGREAFKGKFRLEVMPGGQSMTVSPVKQKMMIEYAGMVGGKFGPEFDLILNRQFLTAFDFRDINALMNAARKGLVPAAPAMGAPGASPEIALGDYTNGQAIRSATNAASE